MVSISRAYDFTLVTIITIISAVIHRMAVELFAPDAPLYAVATDGTQNVNGQAHADLWFQIIAIWVPLAAMGCIALYALIREYKRQVQTATQAAPR